MKKPWILQILLFIKVSEMQTSPSWNIGLDQTAMCGGAGGHQHVSLLPGTLLQLSATTSKVMFVFAAYTWPLSEEIIY